MEATYRQWVQQSGQQQALRAYNDWVFGPNPVYTQGDSDLFVHGNINSPAVRSENPTIGTGTRIVVHVVGVNFIIGDIDTRKNNVDNDSKVSAAVQFSAQNEDRKTSVRFKRKQDPGWTDLTDLVQEVSYPPSPFTADGNNPDLNKWDDPMRKGNQRGAWASKLLLLKIPVAGVFNLESQGTGIAPYAQNTKFEITVQ
jgi:hypothetical protein